MDTVFIGHEIVLLDAVESTNNYAAKGLDQDVLSDGTVIMAHSQTGGRGQRGNVWESEPGQNLTFSLVLRSVSLPVEEKGYLLMLTSLAVLDLLEEYGIDAQVKWPNDVLVDRRKVAGILIENGLRGNLIRQSIIGIGLNVNQESFSVPQATSLVLETGTTYEPKAVLQDLLVHMRARYASLADPAQLKADYLSRLYGRDTPVKVVVDHTIREALVADVEVDGRVVLKDESGTQFYAPGEISFQL